ncbi:MAG TPA: FAD/NAD(P)-binding protein [Usitatibacter sp.]|nr:FAD/NAD(P)-binding protein [Usitatibacter sp.]
MQNRRMVIVGGGFTGAACAVQMARLARGSLEITVVEPRQDLGRGVAYSTADPDHRLNGPLDNHLLDPAEPDALRRWCEAQGVFARDPDAFANNGTAYISRGDFGAYVADMVRLEGRSIVHVRARAVDIVPGEAGETVVLEDGSRLPCALAVLATGNGPTRLPSAFASLPGDPRIIADPLAEPVLPEIPPDARVLVIGASLTALDMASTLVRRGHRGAVNVISRRGLRPRPQRPRGGDADVRALLERIEGPAPEFVTQALSGGSIRSLLHATRDRIAQLEREGATWHAGFDEVRNSVWRFWPALSVVEKRRFLRHLRPWYDVHRFRAPPQNEALVREAEARGLVRFQASRSAPEGRFDAVINCSGLGADCGARDNTLLAKLLQRGRLKPDPSGFGFAVDGDCRPLGADGPQRRLRMLGPPTAGTFGDPLGVIFIAPQVRRACPSMFAAAGLSPG